MATCSANPKSAMVAALADWTFLLADLTGLASRDANCWETALRQRFGSRTPQLAMSIFSFSRKLAHRPRAEAELPTCRRQVESTGPAVGGCRSVSRRFAIRVYIGWRAFCFQAVNRRKKFRGTGMLGRIVKRTGGCKHPRTWQLFPAFDSCTKHQPASMAKAHPGK